VAGARLPPPGIFCFTDTWQDWGQLGRTGITFPFLFGNGTVNEPITDSALAGSGQLG